MSRTPEETVEDATVTKSSGNVFADLNLPDPEERMAKAQLALAITRRIRKLGLSQEQAAQRMGTDQSKVSLLMRGRLTSFTYDRLCRFLTNLGLNVFIEVDEPAEEVEHGKVLATV